MGGLPSLLSILHLLYFSMNYSFFLLYSFSPPTLFSSPSLHGGLLANTRAFFEVLLDSLLFIFLSISSVSHIFISLSRRFSLSLSSLILWLSSVFLFISLFRKIFSLSLLIFDDMMINGRYGQDGYDLIKVTFHY